MNRKIDDLGRLVLPIEMRKELNINNGDEVNIECVGDKIILTKPDTVDYKAIVEEAKKVMFKHLVNEDLGYCYAISELGIHDFVEEMLNTLNNENKN